MISLTEIKLILEGVPSAMFLYIISGVGLDIFDIRQDTFFVVVNKHFFNDIYIIHKYYIFFTFIQYI